MDNISVLAVLVVIWIVAGVIIAWALLSRGKVSSTLDDMISLQIVNNIRAKWDSDHPTVFQCDSPPLPSFTYCDSAGQTTSAGPQQWRGFDADDEAWRKMMTEVGPPIQYHGYLEASVENTFQKCRYCGREWSGDSAAVNSGVCWDGWNGCGASLRQGDHNV